MIPFILTEIQSVALDLIPESLAGWINCFMIMAAFFIAGLLQFWKWQDRKKYRAWLRSMN